MSVLETEVLPQLPQGVTLKPSDYKGIKPVWCPGCGDYAILNALVQVLARNRVDPSKLAIVSGIGCSGRFPAFVKSYGFHGVHGRVLPVATGLKLARPDLTVLAVGGDGDGLAIGMGHLPHAVRRNVDLTYLLFDNHIYGLTKGQPSPTTEVGHKTHASPFGVAEYPLNPLALALIAGATFVGRGFSSHTKHLADLIEQAIRHRGFSFVQIMTPCVTFNDMYKVWKEQAYEIGPDHDTSDFQAALHLATAAEGLPIGIFYQAEKPTYLDRLIAGVKESERLKEARRYDDEADAAGLDKLLERLQ
ncbi:MAG: 2-oxoacid:ferredoxin oxidoreductase subunit beta [Limnochordaceae bacterium]|uniref:2-oxoacid:ferredoxin oxidoreductase subunit beta n=1 Tax=Carboxydichorda subterranea TaxID=3109565 RepID=A0ABZ1BYN1_9FIRM|nr:2-oxoacid:ferredoxin oxidoreductase subunit beta [Limnochorda sp. L945t]MBE3598942.1 2-oxoacid:ferredoxin oxidoreductase subunit beta [Limnochordaceae bacterium]WRP17804.1 2-oxoacid:ferredoxin oxidoreductase subunit beta [Limnochorda sp. L945t]